MGNFISLAEQQELQMQRITLCGLRCWANSRKPGATSNKRGTAGYVVVVWMWVSSLHISGVTIWYWNKFKGTPCFNLPLIWREIKGRFSWGSKGTDLQYIRQSQFQVPRVELIKWLCQQCLEAGKSKWLMYHPYRGGKLAQRVLVLGTGVLCP